MAYDNVKQVVAEYGIAKAEFEEKMKNAFNDIFKTFFEQYPEIKAVGWNQYTPYFNDGEPCEFSVGEVFGVAENARNEDDEELDLNNIYSAYDLEEMKFPYNGKPSPYTYEYRHKYLSYEKDIRAYEKAIAENPRYEEVCNGWKELKSVLNSIPEDIYRNAFNDHVFVLATKNGIDVREYDHD